MQPKLLWTLKAKMRKKCGGGVRRKKNAARKNGKMLQGALRLSTLLSLVFAAIQTPTKMRSKCSETDLARPLRAIGNWRPKHRHRKSRKRVGHLAKKLQNITANARHIGTTNTDGSEKKRANTVHKNPRRNNNHGSAVPRIADRSTLVPLHSEVPAHGHGGMPKTVTGRRSGECI